MVVAADVGIVGRDAELARLGEFVVGISEGPGAIVVRGEAGIGKTVLWRAVLDAAEHAGVRVLVTQCAEVEMPLALGGLADLLDRAFSDVAEELAEPQRRTLGVALGREAPAHEAPDRIALPRAFVACLRALADQSSVLIAIDDVQWLDVASQRILAFALKRLGDARVGILATQRGDSGDPLDLRHALDERFAEVRLGPLSAGALRHLIRTRLGARLPRPTLALLHEASGGNPMFALEFARSLGGHARPQLGPMQIPTSLRDLVGARVERYPHDVRRLLAIAAAAERPTPSLLAAVDPVAAGLLERAVDGEAVTIGHDGIVRFTHPLLASAVYAEVAPSHRRFIHARLARVATGVEERARHLALSSVEPDAAVARLLDEAAARALARGAPDAAADLAQEAIRVTPSGDVSDREERELAVARYLTQAGRHADATARLDALLGTGIAGSRRARALLLFLPVEHDIDVNASNLEEALEHVGDDRHLRAEVLLYVSSCAAYRNEHATAERFAREAATLADESGDPTLLAAALGVVARRAAAAGRPEPALLDRALALAEMHGRLALWPTPRMVAAIDLSLREGDLPRARELLEAELEAILHEGREYDRARVLCALVEVEWRAGRWASAERHLDDVDELAGYGDHTAELYALMARGRLVAARGDIERARRLLAEAAALGQALHLPNLDVCWASGAIELAVGEHERAWEAFQEVAGPPSPHVFELQRLDAVADSVEASVALGRLEQAEELLAALDVPGLEGHLWAAPAAQRCRALLLLARGHGAAAVDAAQEAAAGFEAAGFALDGGRALFVAGEALRRAGERRRAAERLEAASTVFADLGAVLWAERAAKELRRARPRPRRDRGLTSAERQVAALVADGKKNREVAAQLFTTVATVEAHLTRIYRKIDVRSRTELARRVADGSVSLSDE